MFRSALLRGASAGTLALVVSSSLALAQESLPTIDIAGEAPARAKTSKERPASSQNGAGLGGRFTGYTVDMDTAAVSGKDRTSILKTPFNIQIVPRQAMDDQQAISVKDAIVGNVSSVRPASGNFGSNYQQFLIRGIDNTNVYRNNLRQYLNTSLETENLQSIEVLKGPAAMLFGRLEPGGVVNLVVKRPLETPYVSVQEQFGSWSTTRTTLDATGPLTEDKTWLYKVNLDFSRNEHIQKYRTDQNAFVGPTITYHPIEQFQFNLDLEYQNHIFGPDRPIPAVGTRPASLPRSFSPANPGLELDNPSREERRSIGYDWTYDVSNDWRVTNRFYYTNALLTLRQTGISALDEATGDATRNVYDNNDRVLTTLSTNLDLNGKFSIGPFDNAVLLGADYYDFHQRGSNFTGESPFAPPINIYYPVEPLPYYVKLPDNNFFKTVFVWKGVYGQDVISFFDDKVHVLLGGRYDWAENGTGNGRVSDEEARGVYNPATSRGFRTAYDEAFSPRVGLLIQPLPWLSFYGNFSRSFGGTNALPVPGQPLFAPQIGTQFEGGVKAALFDGALTATLAYYDITKSNITVSVPGTPYAVPIGTVRSEGFEFDIAGRLDEHWSVIANYSHDEARITKDSTATGGPGTTGNRMANVPRDAGNLWVKYDADGDFEGLSLGGGFNYVGHRQGDAQNRLRASGLHARERHGHVSLPAELAALGEESDSADQRAENLSIRPYFPNSAGRLFTYPGDGRTILGSLRLEF